ncbi:MAG TPA: 2-dehydropantoate 2-reductase [Gemmatimonadaceae bacterium]
MRTLVVGAGAVGGYFGGRLLEAGRDVTFLVRPRRAAQLAKTGLVIKSPAYGDYHHPSPKTVQADALREHYDLILLSCKAYDLEDAINSFAPAVGPNTAILPVLNGMRHLEVLEQRFGAKAVMGGLAYIASNVDDEGQIVHLNSNHLICFGERDGSLSPRAQAVADEMKGARFDAKLRDAIVQEMWEKWVFIATGAGLTCLMRASVGDIEAAGGAQLALKLGEECAAIATAQGFKPSETSMENTRKAFTTKGSTLTASMFRDIERGGRTECEHLLGDLYRRGKPEEVPVLRIAYTHVATYEVRRAASASG